MTEEKLSLKWNEFQNNITRSYDLLRNEEDFFDVTLVSEDEKHIRSHKLVLASCSPFFKDLMKRLEHPQPLLYLGGVMGEDLQLLLDYIYLGQVNIEQSQLSRFLQVAAKLKLQGLLDIQSDTDLLPTDGSTDRGEASTAGDVIVPLRQQTAWTEKDSIATTIDEETVLVETTDGETMAMNIKVEETRSENYKQELKAPEKRKVEIKLSEKSKIDANYREMRAELIQKNPDGSVTCKVCGRISKSTCAASDMGRHVEIHMEGLSFPCKSCNKTFRSRSFLRHHQKQH